MILCPSRHSMLWAPKYIRVNFLSLLFLVVHERTPQHKAYNRTSRVQFDCGRMGRFFVRLVCRWCCGCAHHCLDMEKRW